MRLLLIAALAPVFIIGIYIYYRDKYEKEPLSLLLKGLLFGALIVFPVSSIETALAVDNMSAFYEAFVVAASTEETWKFLAVMLLIWRNPNFNEKFDGIVYSVFVALGFAGVENISYVLGSGEAALATAFSRAITAVPAHALFGVTMGYYLGLAKFDKTHQAKYIILALILPMLLHGFYDYCLMAKIEWLTVLFVPYIIFMWHFGLKKLNSVEQYDTEDGNQKWILKP